MSVCVYSVFLLSYVQVAALRRADPPSKASKDLGVDHRNAALVLLHAFASAEMCLRSCCLAMNYSGCQASCRNNVFYTPRCQLLIGPLPVMSLVPLLLLHH
jgi:hypothetical protein